MSQSPLEVPPSEGSVDEPHNLSQDPLGELRSLLVGAEVDEKLEAYRVQPDQIAEVLPQAVELTQTEQQPLVEPMKETVENAIKISISQDQEILADTLFPIIGPATRKAVTTAIKTLTDSLNQGLELGLSPQSIGWRIESWRTGRPFAEVVLLRTLLFQVEQVLLIHKQTGLMLQEVDAETSQTQDPELVSAMLTAIEDFVKDSFTTRGNGFLDTVEFGDLNLWIEDGPKAVLACVIRGAAPQSLRPQMQETLELIHKQFDAQLETFNGDREPLGQTRTFLEACLLSQAKPKSKKKRSPLFWIGSVLLLGILLLTARELYLQHQWKNAIATLEETPGIALFHTHRGWNRYQIKGLRDPLATDPQNILEQHQIDPQKVELDFEPYLSLSPRLIEREAQAALRAPAEVQFAYDPTSMTLTLSGKAGQAWISQAQNFPQTHPRIAQVDTSALELLEQEQLLNLKSSIEQTVFSFSEGSRELVGEELERFQSFSEEIRQLTALSQRISLPLTLEIRGRSSATGQFEDNARLSQSRADLLMKKLMQAGVSAEFLKSQGISVTTTDSQPVIQRPQVDFFVNLQQP